MDSQYQFATRDELWRLQEDLKDIFTNQAQQAERLARLEKRKEEDVRMKSLWGPQSPFPGGITATSQHEFNPAAEAFKNFESEPQSSMMSSLHLDHEEERRRGASRANSVRFDESAMNHYGASSRQSMEILPVRTNSSMGSHPLSERSYSHRSDGRGSTPALSLRANSFGLETSRLLGSSHNSPRASTNPPPGFLFLGPVPSIVRCWLSEDFSNDSVLYAAICTGSYSSYISSTIVQNLGLEHAIVDDGSSQKIKMSIYLTEATFQNASSSRSSSPAPQVPVLSARFHVYEAAENDRTIQVIIGSDILRSHNGDILFSEDRLLISDEERNRLAVPLVRPESERTYRGLSTGSNMTASRNQEEESDKTPLRGRMNGQSRPGVIRPPPPRFTAPESSVHSPTPASPAILPSGDTSEAGDQQKADSDIAQVSADQQAMKSEEIPSAGGSGSEKSFTATKPQAPSGVWGNTWRAASSSNPNDGSTKSASGYSRATSGRNMKVLRPAKSMASSTRAVSATGPTFGMENNPPQPTEIARRSSQTSLTDSKATAAKAVESAPTKANPIGQASAFGWLNSGRGRSNGE